MAWYFIIQRDSFIFLDKIFKEYNYNFKIKITLTKLNNLENLLKA